MADTGAIKAGRAYVEVFADKSKLVRGLDSISRDLTAWGKSIQGLGLKIFGAGTAAAGALFGATKYFSKFGDDIAKMSKRTGVSVEALSELSFVASQSGLEFETLENGIRKMQKSITDAGQGTKTAVDTLKELGVTFESIKELTPESQLKLFADKLAGIKDPTKKAGIAMELFGRSGTALLPMFEQGAAGIEKLQAEARKLGLTLSSQDALAAETLNDALDKLWRTVKMGYARIGQALAPVITDLSERMALVIGNISKWIKANPGLIKSIAYMAAGLVAGGLALMTFGTALTVVGSLIGKTVTVLKMIGSIISAITTPIGLVITAIAGLSAAILYYTGAGGKAVEWLKDRFGTLYGELEDAFSGIGAALAKGDIGLAAKILWLTIKMEFYKGKKAVLEIWSSIPTFMLDAWAYSLYGIRVAWAETIAFLIKAWGKFKVYWESGTSVLAEGLVELQKRSELGMVDRNERTGKINKEEAQGQREEIENRYKSIKENLVASDNEKILQADRDRIEANKKAEADLSAAKKKAADALSESLKSSASGYTDSIAGTEAELEKARKEWLAAIAEAKTSSSATAPGMPKPPSLDLGDLQETKAAVSGSFNPNAITQMGGNSPLSKIEKNTRDTAAAVNKWMRWMETHGGFQNNFA